jgi:hypothetical protein
MEWLWIIFGLLAAYAMLSLVSSERQRLINAQPKPEAAPTESAEPSQPEPPIQSIG